MPPNCKLRRHHMDAVLKSGSGEGRGPWCFAYIKVHYLPPNTTSKLQRGGGLSTGICAKQLSIGRRKLRPLILRSNHLIHSRIIIRVIIAFMFPRDMQPRLSQLMFLNILNLNICQGSTVVVFLYRRHYSRQRLQAVSCFGFVLLVVCLRANY